MPFIVEFASQLDGKLRNALTKEQSESAIRFWKDLKRVLDWIADTPMEIGELCFEYKHSNFQSRLAARGPFAIQFAVSEKHQVVVVQKLSLSGNHPYSPEIDDIFNQKP